MGLRPGGCNGTRREKLDLAYVASSLDANCMSLGGRARARGVGWSRCPSRSYSSAFPNLSVPVKPWSHGQVCCRVH